MDLFYFKTTCILCVWRNPVHRILLDRSVMLNGSLTVASTSIYRFKRIFSSRFEFSHEFNEFWWIEVLQPLRSPVINYCQHFSVLPNAFSPPHKSWTDLSSKSGLVLAHSIFMYLCGTNPWPGKMTPNWHFYWWRRFLCIVHWHQGYNGTKCNCFYAISFRCFKQHLRLCCTCIFKE